MLRTACDRGEDPRGLITIREKGQRLQQPSQANEGAFLTAVDQIAAISGRLLISLAINAPPRNRTEEVAKARARAAQRFSK